MSSRHAGHVDNPRSPTTGAVPAGHCAHASSNLDAWAHLFLVPDVSSAPPARRAARPCRSPPQYGYVDSACPETCPGVVSLPDRRKRKNQRNRPTLRNMPSPSGRRMARSLHWRSFPESGRRMERMTRAGRNGTGHDWRSGRPTRLSPSSRCRAHYARA